MRPRSPQSTRGVWENLGGVAVPGSHRAVSDFPFYTGSPVRLRARHWLIVLLGPLVGLFVLSWTSVHLREPLSAVLPQVMFLACAAGGLMAVAGRHWTTLFRTVGRRDVLLMVVIAVMNLMITGALGLVLGQIHHFSPNPEVAALQAASGNVLLLRYVGMLPQLLGEELLAILPFLAALWALHVRAGMSRGAAIALAWVLAALPFALAHLPTYHWDWVQCLVIIGSARLVLSVGYLITRNLWVSAGAHVINDWVLFGALLLVSSH